MKRKIDSKLTAIRNTSEIVSNQVLMWAKQEEALRTQALEPEQTESHMRQANPCRYCGSINPPWNEQHMARSVVSAYSVLPLCCSKENPVLISSVEVLLISSDEALLNSSDKAVSPPAKVDSGGKRVVPPRASKGTAPHRASKRTASSRVCKRTGPSRATKKVPPRVTKKMDSPWNEQYCWHTLVGYIIGYFWPEKFWNDVFVDDYERSMGFSCSKKRKCYEAIWDCWKNQQELYDVRSDGGLETDSQDS